MEVLHDIVKANPLEDYKVAVVFDNGERGVFDCSRYLDRPYWKPLNDKEFFRQVHVDYGTLVWPNDIDVGQEDVWEFSEKEARNSAQITGRSAVVRVTHAHTLPENNLALCARGSRALR